MNPPSESASRFDSFDLFEEARRGDPDALRELVHRFGQRALRVARIRSDRRRGAVPEGRLWTAVEERLARDLQQEAAENLPGLLDRMSRRVERELARLLDGKGAAAEDTGSIPLPVPRRMPNAAQIELFPRNDSGLLEEQALCGVLDALVNELPREARELVIGVDYSGGSLAEVAEELELTLERAETLYRGAWTHLRGELSQRLARLW